jgi:hypothetical protein
MRLHHIAAALRRWFVKPPMTDKQKRDAAKARWWSHNVRLHIHEATNTGRLS